jgi:hypothetical protein
VVLFSQDVGQSPVTESVDVAQFTLAIENFLQSGTKYGKDDDHIAQIIELLGPFPKSFCMSGKWGQ